jgi:nucleotide-binding universal stress UspA family protein
MSKSLPTSLSAIRDVLVGVLVEGERAEAPSAIGYGLTLATAAGAHLTVQSTAWRLSGDDVWLSDFTDDGFARLDRRLDELAHALADRAAGDAAQTGVVCTTESASLSYPDLVARLAAQARLHDLTILDLGPPVYDLDRKTIEKTILRSGRPTIALPPGNGAFRGQRIIVAWDGSAPAARAANDALPFLRAAQAVEIVAVADARELADTVPGAEFAPHLARHGINVTVNDLPVDGSVADTLLAQAGLFRADMIVLGAYGHTRAREFLFGGVTRSLLRSSPVPLFLAH